VLVLALASGLFITRLEPEAPLPPVASRSSPPEVAAATQSPPDPAPIQMAQDQPAAIGVMNFKSLGPSSESPWMKEAIRDNLNGRLSKVPGLEVYSKEYIDFLVEDGSSELAVAQDLGISMMVSGSYLAKGDRLRIEAHVINVETGKLEVSDFVEGEQAEFFDLQSQLAFKIASHMDISMSAEDREALAAVPVGEALDAYRLLLEAEDETSEGATQSDGSGFPNQRPVDEVRRKLQSWLRLVSIVPGAAWAEQPGKNGEEGEIRVVLETYRQAYETKDLELLNSVYIDLSPKQRKAREKYFQNARDLEVEINKVRIAVRGESAIVSYTRADQFTDRITGEAVKLDVRLTKKLQRVEGNWKMTGGKK
jgi:TolB-like protein